MKRILVLFTALLLAPLAMLRADEIILAGGDEVFIVDAAEAAAGKVNKLWSWNAQKADDVPEAARRDFHHMDECKAVERGAKLLVCASGGGCALIERATKRVLWRASSRNAHSLDLLPGDRVVVASSLGGDQVEVFDLKGAATPIFKTPLRSAHGLLWDEARKCLWALGYDELRCYTLADWETAAPSLKLKTTHKLPDDDGHDLRPVPASADLLLTTSNGVHLFDRDQLTFRPHPTLKDLAYVKSVDVHPVTQRIVLSTWGATLRLFSPEDTITFKDARPYKARWMP
ncbi:MAG: DUF6528 family protein [Prosthecobacter sp.]|uniref:DUF6528 family protein n=1 Tax=Prosthecobacter sp. TaxID=1965333 RepID=UPI003900F363